MKRKTPTACSFASGTKPFLFYHVLILVLAIVFTLTCPPKISTNFMDVIPNNGISEGMFNAESAFTSNQDNTINFYIGCSDFSKARIVASIMCDRLSQTGLFESISLESSSIDISDLSSFIGENAYLLLDDETMQRIENSPVDFQNDQLATIFGAFTVSSLDNLGFDPFLLSETVWTDYLSKVSSMTTLSPKEGVLATQIDDIWYVMFSGQLTKKAMAITNSGCVKTIFAICDNLEAENPSVQVCCNGLALHSIESASKSQKEITLITIVSVVLILLMFFLLCRNLHILKLFALSLVLSITSAVCVLVIFFRDIHVMTLIFGTSLIGTCIDYSIHFYVRYAQKKQDEDPSSVQRGLFKSLTIGFGSTEICYLLLLFSPYPILRQISLFSAGGLLSSYLTALFLYPCLVKPKMVREGSFFTKPDISIKAPKAMPFILAAVATVLYLVMIPKIKVHNDIGNLYTPSERLMRYETTASKVLGYSSTTYAIVEEDTSQSVMETLYEFTTQLDSLKTDRVMDGYIAATSFVPPVSRQRRSLESVRTLLPYLQEQADILGLTDEEVQNVRDRLEGEEPFVTIDNLPENVASLVSNVSLGKIGDKYYQVVIIQNAQDNDAIRAVADSFPNIVYFQTSKDVSTQLDELTHMIMILFAVAFAVIMIMLILVFGFKDGIRMAMAPYTVIIGTIALAPLHSFEIDFFFAVGLVLIIGLGLDYIVFACEKNRKGSMKAVLMSFITTELSFGTLLFSSFRPVHIFGSTVFTGILIAFLCAFFARKEDK